MAEILGATPELVREIPVGDPDGVRLFAMPMSVEIPPPDFVHVGGSLHLYFRLRDAGGNPVERGNASFTFSLMRRLVETVSEGTPIVAARPNQHYDEDNAPTGGYIILVVDKANFPPEASHLQVFAQSN